MTRLVRHVRANAVAYLALTVALSGTSYAAIGLGPNSVGAAQIKNHSIDPVKLDPRVFAGFVRHWARVNAQGRIVSSSGGARILPSVGRDQISWGDTFSQHCVPTVTVNDPTGPGGPSTPGFADASVLPAGAKSTAVLVSTYAYGGENQPPSRQPYVVAVMCPVPTK